MEKRNFFLFVYDNIILLVDGIRDSIAARRELSKSKDSLGLMMCNLKITFNVIALAVILGVGILTAYFAVHFATIVINFLSQPQHTALATLAQGLLVIFIISLILESSKEAQSQDRTRRRCGKKGIIQRYTISGATPSP